MSQRSVQVAEELRKIISQILLEDLNDPGIGFVTITRVELTDDLRFARVFYSIFGSDEEKETTEKALFKSMRIIRKLAVERLNMRYAVDIRFEADESLDAGFRIDEILKKIKEQKPNTP